MLKSLVSEALAVVEAWHDAGCGDLYPQEAVLVRAAVESRRIEFATGRRCARQALAELGHTPMPIPSGPNREPIWPAGIVGSITHCRGYRAAVVGLASAIRTVGVDAEKNEPLPPGVIDLVALDTEREQMRELSLHHPDVCWERLLFSAKESVYKAWFPIAREWLDFQQARVVFQADVRVFNVELLIKPRGTVDSLALEHFQGWWARRGDLLCTAIVEPRES